MRAAARRSPICISGGGWKAKLARAVYYPLVEQAVARDGMLGVWSGGVFLRPGGDAVNDILARLKADPLAALRPLLLEAPSSEIGHDDYDLHPELRPATQEVATDAAVLLPLIMRAEPSILFTQRTQHLARHSGQVSFPGGAQRCGRSIAARDRAARDPRRDRDHAGFHPGRRLPAALSHRHRLRYLAGGGGSGGGFYPDAESR